MEHENRNNKTDELTIVKIYDRILRLLGENRFHTISSLKIGVAGCGILGQILPPIFSRLGVAEIRTLDKDIVKIENLPNSLFFNKAHLGLPKSVIATSIAKQYALKNLKTKAYCFDITDQNKEYLLARFLSGLNIVFGCFDSLPPRFALNAAALKFNVPYVDLGIEGFAGRVRLIDRRRGCYACNPLIPTHQATQIFKFSNALPYQEKSGRNCDFAPTVSIMPVALITAALAISIGLSYLGIIGKEPVYDYYYFHLFGEPVTLKITKKEDCIICGVNGEIWWKD
jgi:molybdopterin/thiamine biosynthesis adenylyltransferase